MWFVFSDYDKFPLAWLHKGTLQLSFFFREQNIFFCRKVWLNEFRKKIFSWISFSIGVFPEPFKNLNLVKNKQKLLASKLIVPDKILYLWFVIAACDKNTVWSRNNLLNSELISFCWTVLSSEGSHKRVIFLTALPPPPPLRL